MNTILNRKIIGVTLFLLLPGIFLYGTTGRFAFLFWIYLTMPLFWVNILDVIVPKMYKRVRVRVD